MPTDVAYIFPIFRQKWGSNMFPIFRREAPKFFQYLGINEGPTFISARSAEIFQYILFNFPIFRHKWGSNIYFGASRQFFQYLGINEGPTFSNISARSGENFSIFRHQPANIQYQYLGGSESISVGTVIPWALRIKIKVWPAGHVWPGHKKLKIFKHYCIQYIKEKPFWTLHHHPLRLEVQNNVTNWSQLVTVCDQIPRK